MGGTWNCRYTLSWDATPPQENGRSLTWPEFELLECMRASRRQEITVRQAAELLPTSRTSARRSLEGLAEKGILHKTPASNSDPIRYRRPRSTGSGADVPAAKM